MEYFDLPETGNICWFIHIEVVFCELFKNCVSDVMCSFDSLELKLSIDTTLKLVAVVTKKIWHLY